MPNLAGIAKLFAPVDSTEVIAALIQTGFDAELYLNAHNDLRNVELDTVGSYEHFLLHGYRERRFVPAGKMGEGVDRFLNLRTTNRKIVRDVSLRILMAQASSIKTIEHDWVFDLEVLLKLLESLRVRPIIIFGDSHASLYAKTNLTPDNDEFFDNPIIPVLISCLAGSAMGLNNENSVSQYGNKLINEIKKLKSCKDIPIFLKFGQVDAEFVYIYDCIRRKINKPEFESFEEFANRSIDQYMHFIDRIILEIGTAHTLRICSIFPPTLADSAWRRGYVNGRSARFEGDRTVEELEAAVRELQLPSLFERTLMHVYFNAELQKQCARRKIIFVNDYSEMISESGVIDRKYLGGHSGEDHHLSYDPIAQIIENVKIKYVNVAELGISPFS